MGGVIAVEQQNENFLCRTSDETGFTASPWKHQYAVVFFRTWN